MLKLCHRPAVQQQQQGHQDSETRGVENRLTICAPAALVLAAGRFDAENADHDLYTTAAATELS
jgi:hypothetical protein